MHCSASKKLVMVKDGFHACLIFQLFLFVLAHLRLGSFLTTLNQCAKITISFQAMLLLS